MTDRREDILYRVLLAQLADRSPAEAAARLLALGLADRKACEALAVREEYRRLCLEGIPRCEAMYRTAERFCCSYEKVRSIVYGVRKKTNLSKSKT